MRRRNRRKKYIVLGVLLLVMVALVLFGGLLLHRHSDAPAQPHPAAEYTPENVAFFRQKDAAWEADPLGESRYTMGDSGCLTTCLASVFVMEDIMPEGFSGTLTPGTLNAYFSVHQVYDGEGNLQWDALEEAAGVHMVLQDAQSLEDGQLEQLLAEGVYPIVKVRMGGVGSYHFVLLVSSAGGEFYAMDPLQEEDVLVPLSEFGGDIYAVRYCRNEE